MKRIQWTMLALLCLLATFALVPAAVRADGLTHTVTYVVRFGDSLGSIANAFGTTPQAIAARNGIGNPNRIFVGQRLVIGVATSSIPSAPSSVYIVRRGDTLSAIAFTQHTSVAALVRANGLLNSNHIFVGQRLLVPRAYLVRQWPTTTAYAVQSGDTLSSIAARFGVSPAALLIANNLRNAYMIFTGQVLIIPSPSAQPPSNEPAPTSTTTPPTTSLQPAVCNPSVSISSPLMNQTLGATSVPISGTAGLPSGFDPASQGFSFYKVEFGQGERPILFYVIGSLHYSTASNAQLETWDTSGLANDVYILRLTAVDTLGQFPTPCEVRVSIQH